MLGSLILSDFTVSCLENSVVSQARLTRVWPARPRAQTNVHIHDWLILVPTALSLANVVGRDSLVLCYDILYLKCNKSNCFTWATTWVIAILHHEHLPCMKWDSLVAGCCVDIIDVELEPLGIAIQQWDILKHGSEIDSIQRQVIKMFNTFSFNNVPHWMPAIHTFCICDNYVQRQLLHFEQLRPTPEQIRYCSNGYYA